MRSWAYKTISEGSLLLRNFPGYNGAKTGIMETCQQEKHGKKASIALYDKQDQGLYHTEKWK